MVRRRVTCACVQGVSGEHVPQYPVELYRRAKRAVDRQTVAIKRRLLSLAHAACVRQSEADIKEFFVMAMKR